MSRRIETSSWRKHVKIVDIEKVLRGRRSEAFVTGMERRGRYSRNPCSTAPYTYLFVHYLPLTPRIPLFVPLQPPAVPVELEFAQVLISHDRGTRARACARLYSYFRLTQPATDLLLFEHRMTPFFRHYRPNIVKLSFTLNTIPFPFL